MVLRDGEGGFSEVYNVVLDHVSASWATDENVSVYASKEDAADGAVHDVTIQWSIISEGLSNGFHPKGEHSKGLLIGDGSDWVSVHHNLLARNVKRHPKFKSGTSGPIVNNIVCNSPDVVGLSNAEGTDKAILIDLTANTFWRGRTALATSGASESTQKESPTTSKVYAKGNIQSAAQR